MTSNLQAPASDAPYYPTNTKLQASSRSETLSMLLVPCDNGHKPCQTPVQVGVFFDGTNNNLERDRDGKRIAAKEATVTPKRKIPFPSTEASHSNIVRLFDSFPLAQQASGYYGFYMPGVGTEFTDIGEETETSEGKAFALGGQARIIYGLLQILNALHTTATSSREGLHK